LILQWLLWVIGIPVLIGFPINHVSIIYGTFMSSISLSAAWGLRIPYGSNYHYSCKVVASTTPGRSQTRNPGALQRSARQLNDKKFLKHNLMLRNELL